MTPDAKQAALSFVGVNLIRALRATVRLRHHGDGPLREMEKRGEHFILALWHRHLLLMTYSYQGKGISVLVSQSRDGELMARILGRMGIGTSRGSSSRGGIAGMRNLLRKAAQGYDLAITPDGPRGPASEVQPGVILAAAATGFPIQPLSLAATKVKRLRTWDRFVVPLPLSTVHIVYGEPFTVERRGDPESAAAELKRRLDAGEKEAERLAKEN